MLLSLSSRSRIIHKSRLLSQENELLRYLSSNPAKPKVSSTTVTKRPTAPPSINITPKNTVDQYADKLRTLEPHNVWGITDPLPDPELPENPKEIASLDTAQEMDYRMRNRVATIRQNFSSVTQSPKVQESKWAISFQEGDTATKRWENSLMGWVSSSDAMSNTPMNNFNSAKEAMQFAQKRGWVYEIEEPIVRQPRTDGTLYQDNFLPQNVAKLVKRDGAKCDHWKRDESMKSHYFRPLKFHGDGVVPQHGPNPTQEILPDVESVKKLR